jgi:mRNA interferase HicA
MTYKEFRRWLEARGCKFQAARGSHFKVYLSDKSSIFPMHGKKEINEGLVHRIKKDLGLK